MTMLFLLTFHVLGFNQCVHYTKSLPPDVVNLTGFLILLCASMKNWEEPGYEAVVIIIIMSGFVWEESVDKEQEGGSIYIVHGNSECLVSISQSPTSSFLTYIINVIDLGDSAFIFSTKSQNLHVQGTLPTYENGKRQSHRGA